MRAKPDMKPWVYTNNKIKSSVGAALQREHLFCVVAVHWDSAAPTGLNKCVSMPNPGLTPWAMNKYRPYRAHCMRM